MLEPQLAKALAGSRSQRSTGEQVKWILKRLLAGARPDVLAVARELGISGRTLPRLPDVGGHDACSLAIRSPRKNSGSGPYRAIVDAWVKASSTEVGAANPADIAKLISKAIASSRPKPRYVAPAHARVFLFLRWVLSDRAVRLTAFVERDGN